MACTVFLAMALSMGEVQDAAYRPASQGVPVQLVGLRASRAGRFYSGSCHSRATVYRGNYGCAPRSYSACGTYYRPAHAGACGPACRTYGAHYAPSACGPAGCGPAGCLPAYGRPQGPSSLKPPYPPPASVPPAVESSPSDQPLPPPA